MARHRFTDEEAAAQDAMNKQAESQNAAKQRVELIKNGGDGKGGKLLPGTVSPDFGGSQFGNSGDTSAYDQDVQRARDMGAQGQSRAALTIDQTQANEARGLQLGALGYLRAQADGSAPSSAGILGQRANQNAVMQAGAATTGARGGLGAHLAAQRMAGSQAAGQSMMANAKNADAAALETSRGQSAYSAGALGAQNQDIQAATANAQLEAQQRALNEQRQQEFERRGWNTRSMESQAEDRYNRNSNQAMAINEAQDIARQQRASEESGRTNSAVMAAMTGSTSAMTNAATQPSTPEPQGPSDDDRRDVSTSDPRAKTNSISMGSLARFRKS